MAMEVDSLEAKEWSDLMRRSSELEHKLTVARTALAKIAEDRCDGTGNCARKALWETE